MRKLVFALLVSIVLACLWYLFIRDFEYEVRFTARTLPGDIVQTLRIWSKATEGTTITRVDSTSRVVQNVVRDGSSYIYDWTFEPISDSTTEVQVVISEPDKRLTNKLLVPFTEQKIETDAKELGMQFYEVLKKHLEITSVKVVGEAVTPSSTCVCRYLQTHQTGKAYGMMQDYGLLTTVVANAGLEPSGPPIVNVLKWDHGRDSLRFEFCFPVKKAGQFLPTDVVHLVELESKKALKAIYHGNYITSDRAWYALLKYAADNNYQVSGLPREYFFNNPNMGGNEIEWTAEIYLPVE